MIPKANAPKVSVEGLRISAVSTVAEALDVVSEY
jgi:hypothetical protein